jgi:hypothetical protein
MAIGIFLIPYKRGKNSISGPSRYCEIGDYTSQIQSNGGRWAEVEILGNRAIVKVRAPAAVLTALNGVAGFVRLPKDNIDDPLSDLTTGQKNAIRNNLTDMGYTLAEIQARFGSDLGQYTLRVVLRFAATRRRKPQYDRENDILTVDGEEVACESVDALDLEIME